MLYDELELPDAVGALDDVPSADPDERLRFIALDHYGTKQAYERASRLGSGMLSRRSHVRTKAFYASYRCFYAVLSERSFRDLLRYHLEALLWLVVGFAFPGRQLRSSQAELAKAFHFILHNAARAPIWLLAKTARPTANRVIQVWWPLSFVMRGFLRWEAWNFRRLGLVEREASACREMIETAGYAGRCPDGQEVQYAQELYEQVESENHLAILFISVGRALTIRGEFDVALLMYLRSLWHALATSDISLRRKASGNALRLAYYLQYGACTLHEMRQFELPAQSSSPLNRGDVQKILEASRDGMEAGLAMGERLLNTYANSMDQSMWQRRTRDYVGGGIRSSGAGFFAGQLRVRVLRIGAPRIAQVQRFRVASRH